nr:hypothetical protein [Tanacetum cinerariifolium]
MVAFLSMSDAREATVKKINDDVQLRALIDGKKVVVLEAIIRRDLHLDDADGVECFPNDEIFKELARMGYEKPPPKLTFYKAFFSMQWKFLIHTLVQCHSAKRTVWNDFTCSMASAVIYLATVVMDHQVDDMTTHNTIYTSPALTHKVFANMRRVGKGFSGVETPLFDSMLVLKRMHPNRGIIEAIDADEGITLVDVKTDEEVVPMDVESRERLNQEDVNAVSKGVSAISAPELVSSAEPTKLHDEEIQKATARDKQEKADMERALELQRQYDDKEENIYWSDVAEQNMAGYKMEFSSGMTYDKKSFKKLRVTEVSGSESTQEIPSNDPKEMTEEDVLNMLEIVPVSDFKVEALHVKYPIIDWEIHSKGSRIYWKIIRVGGISEAYQNFEDILKGFDREYLVSLWNLVKEKFSSAVPSEDKEKALWVELKRLFEQDADDVLWKLQIYMHAPLT